MIMAPAIKTRLSCQIVKDIKRKISQGEYLPGQRLSAEKDLCEKYGASRTALREAIQQLQGIRVLKVIKGSGIYIENAAKESLSDAFYNYGYLAKDDELIDLAKLRITLEAENCRLLEESLSRKATLALCEELRDKLENSNLKNMPKMEYSFVRAIADENKKGFNYHLLVPLRKKTNLLIFSPIDAEQHSSILNQMSEVVDLIESGNFNRAGNALRRYLLARLE